MDNQFKHTIGILGGVGPAATAYAHSRLISICQSDYAAIQDIDFPSVVVINYPIQGIDETGYQANYLAKSSLEHSVGDGLGLLEQAGAQVVYMACNTLHGYSHLVKNTSMDDISIINSATEYLQANNFNKVTVLSSRATRREELYASALKKRGLDYRNITDEEQTVIDNVIMSGMSGKNKDQAAAKLRAVISNSLKDSEVVVLGCTELSLIINQETIVSNQVIDSQEIALRNILEKVR